MPPFGPVIFQTHDNANALRGRRQISTKAAIGAKLGKRDFNCGSLSYQLAR